MSVIKQDCAARQTSVITHIGGQQGNQRQMCSSAELGRECRHQLAKWRHELIASVRAEVQWPHSQEIHTEQPVSGCCSSHLGLVGLNRFDARVRHRVCAQQLRYLPGAHLFLHGPQPCEHLHRWGVTTIRGVRHRARAQQRGNLTGKHLLLHGPSPRDHLLRSSAPATSG